MASGLEVAFPEFGDSGAWPAALVEKCFELVSAVLDDLLASIFEDETVPAAVEEVRFVIALSRGLNLRPILRVSMHLNWKVLSLCLLLL